MKHVILLALVAFFLVSCAPDPRREAEAEATRLEAESKAASEEQSRAQAEEIHDLEMQDRRARQEEAQRAWQNIIHVAGIFAQVSVALMVLSVGVSCVWMTLASSHAYSIYVHQRARLIPLDKSTRTFPLLTYSGKGIYMLTNPNDGSVTPLDTRNPADLEKVKAFANVTFAGALAQEARLATRPGELATIPATQIIDGESK